MTRKDIEELIQAKKAMTKFYLNGKEVSKELFLRRYGHGDVDWRIDTMGLNGVKEYTKKGPYNDICKIVID